MKVLNYKKTNINMVSITPPSKVNGGYMSNITYGDKDCFTVQTPELCISDENTISFKMVNNGEFFTLLENLQEKIIHTICENSKEYFNGKVFLEGRIRDSFGDIYTIGENGMVNLHNIKIVDSVKIFNSFKEQISTLPQGNFKASCIMNVSYIKFSGKNIIPVINITHLKFPLEKKKINECILEDSDRESIISYEEINQELEPSKQEKLPEKNSNEFDDFFEE